MVQYLYNSGGEWIAFRDGKFVYGPSGNILGWMADDGQNIADPETRYFGTIYPDDRLYRRLFEPELDAPYPGYPGEHEPPLPPPAKPFATTPLEADDIPELTPA